MLSESRTYLKSEMDCSIRRDHRVHRGIRTERPKKKVRLVLREAVRTIESSPITCPEAVPAESSAESIGNCMRVALQLAS